MKKNYLIIYSYYEYDPAEWEFYQTIEQMDEAVNKLLDVYGDKLEIHFAGKVEEIRYVPAVKVKVMKREA